MGLRETGWDFQLGSLKYIRDYTTFLLLNFPYYGQFQSYANQKLRGIYPHDNDHRNCSRLFSKKGRNRKKDIYLQVEQGIGTLNCDSIRPLAVCDNSF